MDAPHIVTLISPFLAGAALSPKQLKQLSAYLDLLLLWNARMNLTAIRDPEQVATRHFGESLFAARNLYPELGTENSELLDLGSGAGFPGLPIKIWAPDLRVTLLESNQRKSTFLREVIRSLGLTGIDVITARAEQFDANPQSRISNTTVTLRAVERFDDILPAAVHILQQRLKGRYSAERLPANATEPGRESESRGVSRLALLIGESQLGAAGRLAATIEWSEPAPIPLSSRRVLLIGNLR